MYEWDDGGRAAAGFKGTAGDCVVRSVAIASGLPYREVYDRLSEGCRTQRPGKRGKRKASARDGVNVKRKWFRDYMAELGAEWVPTMRIGQGCKVHLTGDELPPVGRLVISLSGHYTAMIDGVIRDIFDPRRPFFDNDLGVARETRCVYGFWRFP